MERRAVPGKEHGWGHGVRLRSARGGERVLGCRHPANAAAEAPESAALTLLSTNALPEGVRIPSEHCAPEHQKRNIRIAEEEPLSTQAVALRGTVQIHEREEKNLGGQSRERGARPLGLSFERAWSVLGECGHSASGGLRGCRPSAREETAEQYSGHDECAPLPLSCRIKCPAG